MYAYVVYSYEEHGADFVEVTIDRLKIAEALHLAFERATAGVATNEKMGAYYLRRRTNLFMRLASLLAQTDEDLASNDGCHALEDGWGGWVLQVNKLV